MPAQNDKPAAFPNRFQRQTMWTALTSVSIVVIAAIAVGSVMLTSWILGYLNPILVPVAVAGILAYLLEPVIGFFTRRGMKRKPAFYLVFALFNGLAILLAFLVIKPAFSQGRAFVNHYLTPEAVAAPADPAAPDASGDSAAPAKDEPSWFARTRMGKIAVEKLQWIDDRIGELGWVSQFKREDQSWDLEGIGTWAWQRVSGFTDEAAGFFGRGFSSAASFLGYFLGLLLVPVYLFFFLRESNVIAESWANYLPLRQSAFKDEVVETLREINQYLIAYFRGQMLVSIIDGVLVAIALSIMGLDYALLLGVFLAILGLIPYIGNLMVMIPAVLIAFAQFNTPDAAWPVWVYPLIVIGIFVVLQQVNGLFTAPKIVGDSVGLHPLTVIFSMLFWSLLLGGLLGALLAVPLTASLKVLFRRYVWERRIEPAVEARLRAAGQAGTEEAGD